MATNKRKAVKPLAIFFYPKEQTLSQVQADAVTEYFEKSGYYVGFRKQLDPVGKRDVIEFDAVCISGVYPSIYTTKFLNDPKRVLDATPIADILSGAAEKAPLPNGNVNPAFAPMSADVGGEDDGASTVAASGKTVTQAVAPVSPASPTSVPSPNNP